MSDAYGESEIGRNAHLRHAPTSGVAGVPRCRTGFRLCLLAVTSMCWISPVDAAAPDCGGVAERACKVWERIPSCDKGLVEDLRKGVCIRPSAASAPSTGGRPGQQHCGRLGQRPCTVIERIPSCDPGLVEDFANRRCSKQVTAPAPARAPCGREGQRPCLITERVPSCDAGLVEDFAKGRCTARAAAPTPAPASACGGEGGRPCLVSERIPSCDQGLVEDFAKGRCFRRAVAPAPTPVPASACGGEGGRPCLVAERIPSCDQGLVEDFAQGRCVRRAAGGLPPTCGRENQRPCLLTERVPSCGAGLYENFNENLCRTLPPGKTVWAASFDSMDEGVRQLGNICSSFLGTAGSGVVLELQKVPASFKAPQAVLNEARLAAHANLRFGTGFLCGIWPYLSSLVEEISFVANTPALFQSTAADIERRRAAFAGAFNRSYGESPCSSLSPIGVRPLCALVRSLPAEGAGRCMTGLVAKVERELGQTRAPEQQFDPEAYLASMEIAGNIAYSMALDAALDAATAGAKSAMSPDKLKKLEKVEDFLKGLRKAFGALQSVQQNVQSLQSELGAIPGCEVLVK